MREIRRLCEACQAISPGWRVSFRGVPEREDWVVCSVTVGGAILFETGGGPVDFVLAEATLKLQTISQRMRDRLKSEDEK